MTMLKSWLQKPYPFVEKQKDKWVLAVSFGVFVALFLIIFQPFGADKVTGNKAIYLSGFGLCVFVGLVINYIILPKLFTKLFNPDKWQIRKEILFILWSFTLIAIFNYLYNSIIGNGIAVPRNLWEFFGITIAVGIFPVVILTFLIEQNLNKQNSKTAITLSKTLSDKKAVSSKDEYIEIHPETLKTKPLKILLKDFIFATSDNNYTTVFYNEGDQVQRKLLRLSLKNLEDQLIEFKTIIRCHRSYIVNKDKIATVKGNARSLILEMEACEELIPVSRSFPKEQLI